MKSDNKIVADDTLTDPVYHSDKTAHYREEVQGALTACPSSHRGVTTPMRTATTELHLHPELVSRRTEQATCPVTEAGRTVSGETS
jgi:hypothetical protein